MYRRCFATAPKTSDKARGIPVRYACVPPGPSGWRAERAPAPPHVSDLRERSRQGSPKVSKRCIWQPKGSHSREEYRFQKRQKKAYVCNTYVQRWPVCVLPRRIGSHRSGPLERSEESGRSRPRCSGEANSRDGGSTEGGNRGKTVCHGRLHAGFCGTFLALAGPFRST